MVKSSTYIPNSCYYNYFWLNLPFTSPRIKLTCTYSTKAFFGGKI
jgi:hypothetical protein